MFLMAQEHTDFPLKDACQESTWSWYSCHQGLPPPHSGGSQYQASYGFYFHSGSMLLPRGDRTGLQMSQFCWFYTVRGIGHIYCRPR